MATTWFGMCHTFTYENKENREHFSLDPTLNYRIMIHDPKFYHILPKSLFPRVLLDYTAGGGGGLRLHGVCEEQPGEDGGL